MLSGMLRTSIKLEEFSRYFSMSDLDLIPPPAENTKLQKPLMSYPCEAGNDELAKKVAKMAQHKLRIADIK
jgi:hypothetical protein